MFQVPVHYKRVQYAGKVTVCCFTNFTSTLRTQFGTLQIATCKKDKSTSNGLFFQTYHKDQLYKCRLIYHTWMVWGMEALLQIDCSVMLLGTKTLLIFFADYRPNTARCNTNLRYFPNYKPLKFHRTLYQELIMSILFLGWIGQFFMSLCLVQTTTAGLFFDIFLVAARKGTAQGVFC